MIPYLQYRRTETRIMSAGNRFEKLRSVPVEFMVEEDDTAPKGLDFG